MIEKHFRSLQRPVQPILRRFDNMLRTARLVPAVLACWLMVGSRAPAAVPEVKDEGKFFSADTIKKANAILREVHDQDHKDLYIETYATAPNNDAERVTKMGK